jgi:hypothetical protein
MNDIKAHAHEARHPALRDTPIKWSDAQPPLAPRFSPGRLRGCSFCGSMHPADLAAALAAGARVHWADRKYGWPHKIYIDGVPNPHAGLPESTCSGNPNPTPEGWVRVQTGTFNTHTGDPEYTWIAPPHPAPATAHGKFYTEHLQDATAEERLAIERAMGISFTFLDGGGISWQPFAENVA